jgi:dihydroxyacetone kinase-like protein
MAANGGKGVLLVIKNYTGDVMNFEMAADMAADEGVEVEKVVVADDVAVENSTWTTGRRGIAGTIFVHKLAGACAEAGGDLATVKAVAEKVIANVRSMGMAVDACTVPAAGKPSFDLAEDEIEIGIGIHGEPGVNREKISSVNEIADKLLAKILDEGIYGEGDEVAVMVNGMGGTPLMELFVANKHIAEVLAGKGIKIYKTLVGNYMTSLDMEGFSITLLKLDDELKPLLDAPADTPAFVQV